MNTIYIILAFLFIATLVYYFVFYRRGKIKDKDGDFIPDEVENTVEEIRQRAKDVKEEMEDVIEATKEVVKQAGDVVDAIKGKSKQGPSKRMGGSRAYRRSNKK